MLPKRRTSNRLTLITPVNGDGCLTLPRARGTPTSTADKDSPCGAATKTSLRSSDDAHQLTAAIMTGEDASWAKPTAIEALLSGTTTLGEYASEVAELADCAYRPPLEQGRRHERG